MTYSNSRQNDRSRSRAADKGRSSQSPQKRNRPKGSGSTLALCVGIAVALTLAVAGAAKLKSSPEPIDTVDQPQIASQPTRPSQGISQDGSQSTLPSRNVDLSKLAEPNRLYKEARVLVGEAQNIRDRNAKLAKYDEADKLLDKALELCRAIEGYEDSRTVESRIRDIHQLRHNIIKSRPF